VNVKEIPSKPRKALDTAIRKLCQSDMAVDVPKGTVIISLELFTKVVVAFDAVEKTRDSAANVKMLEYLTTQATENA